MALTRQQIKVKLAELDQDTDKWFQAHGETSDFWCLFANKADDITENVGEQEHDWAFEQIDAILEKHGIDPNRDVSPCDG